MDRPFLVGSGGSGDLTAEQWALANPLVAPAPDTPPPPPPPLWSSASKLTAPPPPSRNSPQWEQDNPLLSPRSSESDARGKNFALEHVAALTTRSAWWSWSLAAAFAVLGLLSTELHTWSILTQRTITGCARGNATVLANATLSSCADAGLFACQATPTVTTQVPALWALGLFLLLLGVVCLWGVVAWAISAQNWRASCLLPYHVVVQAKSFNGAFYTAALAATLLYEVLKYFTFAAQPGSVALRCGPATVTAMLLPVFAPAAGGGQWGTLGASLATFWLSFASMSALISRYAADSYADITLSTLLSCGARGVCDSHSGQPSAVVRALSQPFLVVAAEELDTLMKAWYLARRLKERRLKWNEARFLLKMGQSVELVADAAAWVRAAKGAGSVQEK